MAEVDLQYTMGMDEKAYMDGLNRAKQQTAHFNTSVTDSTKKAAATFSGHFKSGFGQAAFAVQDFAVVLGQGGHNSLGRAVMAASNNIGMLGMAFGPWGMAAATGASVLAATLLPALLNAADGSKAASEGLQRFLDTSNRIGKNVDLRTQFGRQLEDLMRGGGGGLVNFTRDLQRQNEDIKAEMDVLQGQFHTSGKILESYFEAQERIRQEYANRERAIGDGADLDTLDRLAKERDTKLAELAKQQENLHRLQPEELKKRFPTANAEQLKQLTDLQKAWGDLADKMREVEAAQKNAAEAANRPLLPKDVGAHLRNSMEAAGAEIAFLNKSWMIPGTAAAPVGPLPAAGQPGRRGFGDAQFAGMVLAPGNKNFRLAGMNRDELLEGARARNRAVEDARDPNRDLFNEDAKADRRQNLQVAKDLLEAARRQAEELRGMRQDLRKGAGGNLKVKVIPGRGGGG